MTTLTHGGDWAGYLEETGQLPQDFSANVSPLGLPEGVARAAAAALTAADRYPDPLCRELRAALAQHLGLSPEEILCGAGAADLIYRLVLAVHPRRALVTAPAFAEYETALDTLGCKTEHFLLKEEDDFAVTPALLEKITPGLELLFLCEPNNPTGRTTDPALLRDILQRCAACGTLLVMDECFGEFLADPEAHTLRGELDRYPNLLILKAFTKWYGMAGLRLGYCLCSDRALLERMARCGQPWAVSHPAQAAGVAALQETAYSRRLHELICTQRPLLADGLRALGCRVVPGEANYLLFYHPDPALLQKMRRKGFLLRDCSSYDGLGPGWLRTAVRTGEENAALLRAMKEVLG